MALRITVNGQTRYTRDATHTQELLGYTPEWIINARTAGGEHNLDTCETCAERVERERERTTDPDAFYQRMREEIRRLEGSQVKDYRMRTQADIVSDRIIVMRRAIAIVQLAQRVPDRDLGEALKALAREHKRWTELDAIGAPHATVMMRALGWARAHVWNRILRTYSPAA